MNRCPDEAQHERRNPISHQGTDNDADDIGYDSDDSRSENTAVEKFPFYFGTDEGRRNDLVGNHDENDSHNQDDDTFHDVIGHIAAIEFLRFRFLMARFIFIFHRVKKHLPFVYTSITILVYHISRQCTTGGV